MAREEGKVGLARGVHHNDDNDDNDSNDEEKEGRANLGQQRGGTQQR